MVYTLRTARVKDSGCGRRLIGFGEQVVVDADCQAEAKQKAAAIRMCDRHNQQSTYHEWLQAHVEGRRPLVSFGYGWLIDVVEFSV